MRKSIAAFLRRLADDIDPPRALLEAIRVSATASRDALNDMKAIAAQMVEEIRAPLPKKPVRKRKTRKA